MLFTLKHVIVTLIHTRIMFVCVDESYFSYPDRFFLTRLSFNECVFSKAFANRRFLLKNLKQKLVVNLKNSLNPYVYAIKLSFSSEQVLVAEIYILTMKSLFT